MQFSYMKMHQAIKHNGFLPYRCSQNDCSMRFSTKASLSRHIIATHKVSSGNQTSFSDKPIEKHHIPLPIDTLKSKSSLNAITKKSGDQYTCQFCYTKFSTKFSLTRHLSTTHGVSVPSHNCRQCQQVYSSKSALIRHEKAAHQGLKRWKCVICEKTFSRRYIAKNHMANMHSNYFNGKISKRNRVRTRSKSLGNLENMFSEATMDTLITTVNPVDINITTENDNEYQCTECSRFFLSHLSLKRHISMKHNQKNDLLFNPHAACFSCNTRFLSKSKFSRHKKIIKIQNCSHCDSIFDTECQLNKHRAVCRESKSLKMVKIPLETQYEALSCFELLKKQNLFDDECGVSEKVFYEVTKKSFGKQTTKVVSQRKIHVCSVCNKEFQRVSDMKRCLKRHQGLKDHQCKKCDKSFNNKSQLNQHIKIVHEKTAKVQCHLCYKNYANKSSLKLHMKNQHLS